MTLINFGKSPEAPRGAGRPSGGLGTSLTPGSSSGCPPQKLVDPVPGNGKGSYDRLRLSHCEEPRLTRVRCSLHGFEQRLPGNDVLDRAYDADTKLSVSVSALMPESLPPPPDREPVGLVPRRMLIAGNRQGTEAALITRATRAQKRMRDWT
jgi:hypothetical protein